MALSNRLDLYMKVDNETDSLREIDHLMTSLIGMNLKTNDTYTVTNVTESRLDLIS